MDLFSLMMLREFLVGPRRPWFHFKRMGFAAMSGALILFMFFATSRDNADSAGLILFKYLSFLSVIAACLLGPYIAAAGLISEKEGRTLDLLYMSDLSASQLITSKFASATVGAALVVLSVIPMFLLCVSLGGVAEVQIFIALGVLCSAMLLGTALGLLVGVLIDSESHTQRALIAGFVVVFGFIPLVAAGVSGVLGLDPLITVENPATAVSGVSWWVTATSPFFAIKAVSAAQIQDGAAVANCLINLVLAIPLILIAIIILPGRLVASPNSPVERLKRLFIGSERIGGDGKANNNRRASSRRPRLRGNPVRWKDVHVLYGGEDRIWMIAILGSLLGAFFSAVVYVVMAQLITGNYSVLTAMFTMSVAALIISAIAFIVGSVTRAIRTLGREMNGRTLELLLSSDLTVTDIVDGKANAILVSVMPYMIMIAITTVTTAFLGRVVLALEYDGILLMLAFPLNAVGMVYAYNFIAMRMSLKSEQQSTAMGVSGFVVWYIVGNVIVSVAAVILIPFTALLSIILLPFLGPIIIGYQMRLTLLRTLRRMAVARAF